MFDLHQRSCSILFRKRRPCHESFPLAMTEARLSWESALERFYDAAQACRACRWDGSDLPLAWTAPATTRRFMCFLEDLKGHQRHNLRLDETCRDAFKIFKLTSDLSGQSSLSHAWHAHRTPFLTLETNDLLEVWCHRIFRHLNLNVTGTMETQFEVCQLVFQRLLSWLIHASPHVWRV